ncbi:hypothetical protein LWI29_029011 [Acer saccharum]|uniref:Ty3 transposon capsid-like protein domain-containing protein n=1 Tax=Acer saccharum TaxID=4024 RepID=A0AA39SV66_ACESA|nr:hypothetical protein LWI29_029011 [Acer saccharum]
MPFINSEHVEREHSAASLTSQGERIDNTNVVRPIGSQQSFYPRLVKLDFLRFRGEKDTRSWICRVEQFFNFHQTPKRERVALAFFHLEGDTQLWYQTLKQEKRELQWQDFNDGLHSRFGPTQFQDFFGDLTKLQQLSSVRTYQTQFEKLLSKVGFLPQAHQVSCFISGLNDTIWADVLAGRPASLTDAISLARLYEA